MVRFLRPALATSDTRSVLPAPKQRASVYGTAEHAAWAAEVIRRAGGQDDGLIDTTDDAKDLPFRTADTLEKGDELTFLGEALYGQKIIVHEDRGRLALDGMMKMFGMERRVRVNRDRVKRSEDDR